MFEIALIGLVGAMLICLFDVKKGLLACLLVGFLQDVLRKVVPGEPVSFVLGAAICFTIVFIGLRLRGRPLRARELGAWPSLRIPVEMFVLWVGIETVATFIRTSNLILAGIGIIAYLAPLPAVLVGHYLARDPRAMSRFLAAYIALSTVMASGLYLSSTGYNWKVLHSVGTQMVVYGENRVIPLLSGFFRAPEIAAWHCAAAACVLMVLVTRARPGLKGVLLLATVIPYLCGAMILTGRRKFLAEIAVFLLIYGLLSMKFKCGAKRIVSVAIASGVVIGLGLMVVPDAGEIGFYLGRSASTSGAVVGRLSGVLGSLQWVLAWNGFLGSGAGTGSQGGQHFGADPSIGLAAENGPGKVLAELGVPGLLLVGIVILRLGKYVWNRLGRLRDVGVRRGACGGVALLVANASVFVSAMQVFGDPFILLLLGWFVGFVLASLEPAPTAPPGRVPARLVSAPWKQPELAK